MTEDTYQGNRAERHEQAARQAVEWLVLSAHELSPAQRVEFMEWLLESRLHVAEALRVGYVHAALKAFRGWEDVPRSVPAPEGNVVDIRPAASRVLIPRRRCWPSLTAAAAMAIVVAGLMWFTSFRGETSFSTQLGERRELVMADGSVVDLAPASELRVHFTKAERDLSLVSGEAFFRDTKDPSRPFVVTAGTTRVRAVGTAFGVRRETGATSVTVVEGQVRVSNAQAVSSAGRADAVPAAVLVGANEQVRVASSTGPSVVHHVDAAAEMAWTEGELIFEDQSVAEVVRRFNAYNKVQIVIDDPTLASRRVSGVFRATDPGSFVDFIQSTTGLPVVRQGDGRILVGGDGQGVADPH